jgi:hypothetical protein
MDRMDEKDLELDFEDLGGDPDMDVDVNTEIFYWALKGALERTQLEPPPAQ